MTGPLPPEQKNEDWSRDLVESDRRYFEAAAELVAIPGAVIAATRGLETLASGCVVQRVDTARVAADPEPWLTDLEARLREMGSALARLYLDAPNAAVEDAPDSALERSLRRRGYRSRVEYGLARAAGGEENGVHIELRGAQDEAGWLERRRLMRRVGVSPDGHGADADLWVELERRKHAAGYMRPYLVEVDGEVVGAASSAACERLLRVKNVAVDPAHRRRGIATAIVAGLARKAAEEGFAAAGCFVAEGEPGLVAYPRAGYRVIVTQTEWTRDLGE